MNPAPDPTPAAPAQWRDIVPNVDIWQIGDQAHHCTKCWQTLTSDDCLIGLVSDGTLRGRRPLDVTLAPSGAMCAAYVGGRNFYANTPGELKEQVFREFPDLDEEWYRSHCSPPSPRAATAVETAFVCPVHGPRYETFCTLCADAHPTPPMTHNPNAATSGGDTI
jgi:hypothetical protein